MNHIKTVIFLTVLCFGLIGVGVADDSTPPEWRKTAAPDGEEWFKTFNQWEFEEPPPEEPETDELPNVLFPEETDQTFWEQTYNGRQGVWRLDSVDITFQVPEHAGPGEKLVHIQVTYFPTDISVPAVVVVGGLLEGGIQTKDAENGWKHQITDWRNDKECPDLDVIGVTAPDGSVIYVDEVVIDTLCITTKGGGLFGFWELFALVAVLMLSLVGKSRS